MVIRVLDLVTDCNSRRSGEIVGKAIKRAFTGDDRVIVCFSGVEDIPSTFANLAFVPLLDSHDLSEIRQRLRVKNSTQQINEMIKRRLEFESKRRKRHPIALKHTALAAE